MFNYQWELNGWQYGFLQPVNRSLTRLQGQRADLRLYTIAPTKEQFHVAEIRECEVLTEDLARAALREFERSGWTADMERDVRAIGGNLKGLHYKKPTERLNVRFQPANVQLFEPMRRAEIDEAVQRLDRYQLVRVGVDNNLASERHSRSGTTQRKVLGSQTRSAVPAHNVELRHDPLQQELFDALAGHFGPEVVMEEDFVDIKVRRPGGLTLIEVKIAPTALKALRESVGQLLEYSFACAQGGEKVARLVVAAPCELDAQGAAFLAHLRREHSLDIEYLPIRRGRVRTALNEWLGQESSLRRSGQ